MSHPIEPITLLGTQTLKSDESYPTEPLGLIEAVEKLSIKIFLHHLSSIQQGKGKVFITDVALMAPILTISQKGKKCCQALKPAISEKSHRVRSHKKKRRYSVAQGRVSTKPINTLPLPPTEKSQINKNSLWDQIIKCENPSLVEGLVDLYNLLHLKEKQCKPIQDGNIINFALELVKEDVANPQLIIGELTYLANSRIEDVANMVCRERLTASIEWIQDTFQKEMRKKLKKLSNLRIHHQRSGIQDGNIALKKLLPIEMTQVLITDTGKVNVGIIEKLIEIFVKRPNHPNNFDISLIQGLKALQTSSDLREKLGQIKKPSSLFAPANVVIRTTLGLSPDTQIRDVDAIKVALSAVLSHLRQGSDGSCFATPLAIALLSSDPEHCVGDFHSLLRMSKLTRTVNSGTHDFPFLLRMSEENLDNTLTIHQNGVLDTMISKGIELWKVPGLIAVCKEIGIDNPSRAFKEIIGDFIKENEDPNELIQITLRALLQNLVKYASKKDINKEEVLGMLFLRACFAFEAQVNHPLLQVWENTIASMAEAGESSIVRSAVIYSVIDTIKTKLKTLMPEHSSSRKTIMRNIRTELVSRIHLQYDPIVSNDEVSKDQKSTEGAFVLYDKSHYPHRSCWLRVDNPQTFQTFISQVMEEAKKEIKKETHDLEKEEKTALRHNITQLRDFIITPDFITNCLVQYYHRNAEISNPLSNYETIKYAPWVTKSGNDFSKVLQVYFEDSQKCESHHYFPTDAKDLFIKIIEEGKNSSLEEKETFQDNPYKFHPARIPGVHAFSLMLGHPSLMKAWGNSADSETWIMKHVIEPGRKIAEFPINSKTREELISFACENLLPIDKKKDFLHRVCSIPENIPTKDFRQSLLQEIFELDSDIASASDVISQQLDDFLMNNLPKQAKKKLEKTAVHFADTNWSEVTHDIHLCFVVNPGNGELEIWATYDTGKKMFLLNQDQWLKNKEWEFFGDFKS